MVLYQQKYNSFYGYKILIIYVNFKEFLEPKRKNDADFLDKIIFI